jgi:hypothetical protein
MRRILYWSAGRRRSYGSYRAANAAYTGFHAQRSPGIIGREKAGAFTLTTAAGSARSAKMSSVNSALAVTCVVDRSLLEGTISANPCRLPSMRRDAPQLHDGEMLTATYPVGMFV